MHDTPPPECRLTPEQETRVALARADLTLARDTDLAAADPAQLITLVESLRGSLDDVLELLTDLAM
ncbi:hypothetical protein ACF082_29670 [Streptomyces lydicus]|uniref:hypothetical protein n=1 Tax=Streptomyces lydicus TaxID=47763 RepID=UPI0036FCEB4E